MQIDIITNLGTDSYDVDVLQSFKCRPVQKVEYVTTLNGKTHPYNYGANADKWFSEITISGTKEYIASVSESLNKDIEYLKLYTNVTGEYYPIFGAGIDYSYDDIKAIVTNSTRQYSEENFANSEIKLSLIAIGYDDDTQLKYKSSTPDGLPSCVNFQHPIDRDIVKRDGYQLSEDFGDVYRGVEVQEDGTPTSKYNLSIVFEQTREEAAQIEKFVNTQRSDSFVFSEADIVYLFPDQSYTEIMITGFITNMISNDLWLLTLEFTIIPVNLPKTIVSVSSDGADRMMYSLDSGETWDFENIGDYDFYDIEFGSNSFCACSNNNPVILTSFDGINFENYAGDVTGWKFLNITYGNGRFVANDFDNSRCYYSDDNGLTWDSSNYSNSTDIYCGAYGNGIYVFGTSKDLTLGRIYYSVDGISNYQIGVQTTSNRKFETITYGSAGFFAPLNEQFTAYKSTDGINWSSVVIPQIITQVVYGNGLYVGIARFGVSTISTDLINFSTYIMGIGYSNTSYEGLIFDGTYFVAVARSGTYRVIGSLDGQTWEIITPTQLNSFQGLAGN